MSHRCRFCDRDIVRTDAGWEHVGDACSLDLRHDPTRRIIRPVSPREPEAYLREAVGDGDRSAPQVLTAAVKASGLPYPYLGRTLDEMVRAGEFRVTEETWQQGLGRVPILWPKGSEVAA